MRPLPWGQFATDNGSGLWYASTVTNCNGLVSILVTVPLQKSIRSSVKALCPYGNSLTFEKKFDIIIVLSSKKA